MSKQFICDKCGHKFPQAIEEIPYKDEHGVWHTMDLCAPCKNILEENKVKLEKEFTK